jgi:hypothetical protein
MLEMRGVKLIVLPPSHVSESHREGGSQAAIPPLLLPTEYQIIQDQYPKTEFRGKVKSLKHGKSIIYPFILVASGDFPNG